jgi:hypothetical protein
MQQKKGIRKARVPSTPKHGRGYSMKTSSETGTQAENFGEKNLIISTLGNLFEPKHSEKIPAVTIVSY